MATSGSACIVPQNMRLAVVDCEAISAQVSGRGCCQHTDARAVGKRSDIEAAGGGGRGVSVCRATSATSVGAGPRDIAHDQSVAKTSFTSIAWSEAHSHTIAEASRGACLRVRFGAVIPVWCNVTRGYRADGMTVAKRSKSEFDPRAFLAKADGGVTVSNYSKGQVVFTQGEPANAVFYIQEGKVKIAVVSAQGKEAVVAFLKAGDFIGEGCLTGRPRRVSAATALADCILTRVDKSTMVRMLRDEPNFSEPFMVHLLSRTLRVEEDLVDQLFNSSEKRLARALLLLANFGKDGKHETVIAKVAKRRSPTWSARRAPA